MKSKWEAHKKRILELAEQNDYKPYAVLRLLSEELNVSQGNALRNYITYLLNSAPKKPKLKVTSSSKTSSNNYSKPFVLSAWSNK